MDIGGVNPKWSAVAGDSLDRTLKEAIPVAMVIGAGGALARLAAQRRQKKTYEKLKTAAKKDKVVEQKVEPEPPPRNPEVINGSKEQPLATAPVVTVTKTASRGDGVDPTYYEASGRRLAQYMWSELEKIGAATSSPSADMESQHGAMQGTVQQGAEGEEEASPSHGVVAARVEQLDDKKARGIPVIQPPPGFVFAPELQSFIPDESNPAWIQAEQAAEAAKNKSFYDQGQRDVQGQLVQEAATQQQAQAEAQVMQESMQQQVDGAKGKPAAAKTPASISGKPAAKKPAAEAGGKKPAAKKSEGKDGKKAPGDKGVVINIGSEKKAADSGSEGALAGEILLNHPLGAALGAAAGARDERKGKAAIGAGAGSLGGRVGGSYAAKGISAAVGKKLGIKDPDMLERVVSRLGGAVGAWHGSKLGTNKEASDKKRQKSIDKHVAVGSALGFGAALGAGAIGLTRASSLRRAAAKALAAGDAEVGKARHFYKSPFDSGKLFGSLESAERHFREGKELNRKAKITSRYAGDGALAGAMPATAVGAATGELVGRLRNRKKEKKASVEDLRDRLQDPEYREKVLNAIRSLQETP
jgi:hypothetical protein